jgi:hypothetical protein
LDLTPAKFGKLMGFLIKSAPLVDLEEEEAR